MSKFSARYLFLAVLIAAPVWAHHNMSAIFDFNQRFTGSGYLTALDWRNPHVYLTVEIPNESEEIEVWSFEGPPPGFFRNRDFSRTDFENSLEKIVVVEASRARDGSMSGLIRQVTLADGTVVSACPQNC